MKELQALRERIKAMRRYVILVNCDTPEDGYKEALKSLDEWARANMASLKKSPRQRG